MQSALNQMNEAQKTSLNNLIARYESEPTELYYGLVGMPETAVAVWPFISIAIEPDGYAHS